MPVPTRFRQRQWPTLRALCWLGVALAPLRTEALGPSLVGIDHVPMVVGDLDRAGRMFKDLGFALKPGRPHDNGLRNAHLKFADGSGLEFIAPPARPPDAQTLRYRELLAQGEGPAYLSFHARDMAALRAALTAAGIGFAGDDELLSLTEPALEFVFFVRDNRSPTDRPEHFAHANTAMAMTGVWLAPDPASRTALEKLLLAVGATRTKEVGTGDTGVFRVQNGRVMLAPPSRQVCPGRPVVGVEFRVRHRDSLPSRASGATPRMACGPWLSFHE